MADPVLSEVAKAVASQGLLFAVLVTIIVTGLRRVWVPGFAYTEKVKERDEAVATLNKFVGIHEALTDEVRALRSEVQVLKQERRGR